MEENLNTQIRKLALAKGLLLGVISLVLGIFSFYFITTMTDSMWLIICVPVIISLIIPTVIAVLFTLDIRKQIGGYWVFRQAVTGTFIMFFVSYVISGIGKDVIFSKLVEPDMTQKMGLAITNSTVKMLEKNGADQTKIDDTIDQMQKKFDEQSNTSVGKIIQGIAISIIFIFVFALIFGAIFKKEPLKNSLEDAIDPTE